MKPMRSSGWVVPALSATIVACASPAPSWAPAASVPPSASTAVVAKPLAKARALAARGVLDTGGAAALAVAEASGDPEAFAFAARCFEQGWAEERAVAAWNAVAKHPRATKELVAEASSALAARPAATAPLSETARTLALSSALRSRDPADAIRVLEAVALRGERRLLDRLGVLLERAGRDADAQRAWARARASSSAVGVTLGGLSWHVWARPVTRVVAIEDNTALMGGSEVDSGFSVDLLTGTVRATLTGTYFDTMTSLGCRDVVAAANHAVAGSCEDGHGHFIAHPTSFGTPEKTSCGRAALDPKGRAAAFACKDAVWLVLPDYERKPVRVGIANTTARLALSEDAGLVAVASGGKIALFDWTGKARSSFEYDPKEPVTEVVFAGADRLVAAHERAVEVYDLKKLERVASVGVPDPPSSLHHVPGADAIDLVLGSKLARLKLPSLALEPRDTVLSSFARSPTGPFAAGVHVTDGATTQWSILDAETGATLANGGPTHDTVERVASSQNHRWLVVATTTGVGVHDLQASTYRFEKTGRIRAMTIDDDKSEVVLVASMAASSGAASTRWLSPLPTRRMP